MDLLDARSACVEDTLVTQVPQHIREKYPHFVQFLRGYYEWLCQDGNPYGRIRDHLDYLSFEKTLDQYVEFLEKEYLTKLPSSILEDKELFLAWSKKFNLARGSHESYKFLFRVLFGEETTEIYLPKDNILRTSDGEWIANQHSMLVTNEGNPDDFLFKIIHQKRELVPGHYEVVSATVDSYRVSYNAGFSIIELILVDLDGEFDLTHEIYTEDGKKAWPVPTVVDFNIQNGGVNYSIGQRLHLDPAYWNQQYWIEGDVTTTGEFDTHMTTLLDKNQLKVKINGIINLNNFEYDGQVITSPHLHNGDTVKVTFLTSFGGEFVVADHDDLRSVTDIDVSDAPIAIQPGQTYPLVADDPFSSGLQAEAIVGAVRKIPGYYRGQKGQLSSNMYLEDSNYYQEYSYEIITEQNLSKYKDIVKDVLHPAGFKMFGHIRFIILIEAIISGNISVSIVPSQIIQQYINSPRYTAGVNYEWIARTRGGFMSPRMYQGDEWDKSFTDIGFCSKPIDWNGLTKHYEEDDYNDDGYLQNERRFLEFQESTYSVPHYTDDHYSESGFDFSGGQNQPHQVQTYCGRGYSDDHYSQWLQVYEDCYTLQDKSKERRFDEDGNPVHIDLKGWMTAQNLVDADILQPQDYFAHDEYKYLYIESSYISTVDMDIDKFKQDYID